MKIKVLQIIRREFEFQMASSWYQVLQTFEKVNAKIYVNLCRDVAVKPFCQFYHG